MNSRTIFRTTDVVASLDRLEPCRLQEWNEVAFLFVFAEDATAGRCLDRRGRGDLSAGNALLPRSSEQLHTTARLATRLRPAPPCVDQVW